MLLFPPRQTAILPIMMKKFMAPTDSEICAETGGNHSTDNERTHGTNGPQYLRQNGVSAHSSMESAHSLGESTHSTVASNHLPMEDDDLTVAENHLRQSLARPQRTRWRPRTPSSSSTTKNFNPIPVDAMITQNQQIGFQNQQIGTQNQLVSVQNQSVGYLLVSKTEVLVLKADLIVLNNASTGVGLTFVGIRAAASGPWPPSGSLWPGK
ncbi:hypothetical protein MJO28_009313 [Puccinia striiformis f. sp. tritici]|uniref:Uncharacterized protein n=1 Tax=Puccinia striiformis f. sp. tritici TaxID=168172 RepID=A0ACC0E8V6_9BASI|nr:hypothetical protein MJO28_009313 [Puccinia striiformis f. sp. tritici]